jgi:hemolysin D
MAASSSSHLLDTWQSKTDTVLSRHGRFVGSPALWTLAALPIVIVGLSAFLTVDRVVTSNAGKIVATQALSNLQALDPSIIKTVDVKEGERVTKGQLLATLDTTFASADVDQLRNQIVAYDAQIARDKAEQAGEPYRPAGEADAEREAAVAVQRRLYTSRMASLTSQTRSFDEKIAGMHASITRVETEQRHLLEREEIAGKIEGMRSTLYNNGSSSLLNMLEASDTHLEIQRTMENDKNSLVELQHQLSGLESDRQAAIHQWNSAAGQELVDTQKLRDDAAAALEKAVKHQDLVRLTADEPSVVLTLTKLSAGSVLNQGDAIMTLVPLSSPVEAEIHFAAGDIGFVRPGNDVTIKVDAFNSFEHGTAKGKVVWISEGTFTTDEDAKPVDPYYKARISIDETNFINVPVSFRLISGMTLVADINVGKRSMFKLVTSTVFHGLSEALREP